MQKLGYLMVTIGFLAGALAATADKDVVYWDYFLASVVVGAGGVACVHLGKRRQRREVGKLTADGQVIEASLARMAENITRLNEQKQSINTYDMRHRIDELFVEDLVAFVEARESIAHVHGLQAYADVMSSFAAGERYLNRVWSASADGYIDEVNIYLDKAREQFVESLNKIRGLKQNKASDHTSLGRLQDQKN
jgi:hypothetical protein